MSRSLQQPTLRRPPTSAWLHAALALALLLVQAVGLLHRTAHGPQLFVSSHADHAHVADAHAASAHAAPPHAAASPFGHTAGQGDACRLFDQLALADVLADASPALPVFDAPCRAIEATGTAGARAVATAYRARAPPARG